MSDINSSITNAAQALHSWPLIEAFFLVVIAFIGVYLRWIGGREREARSNDHVDMPLYLMIHDAARDINSIRVLLERLNRGQEYTHRILEDMHRDRELRPPPAPMGDG